MLLISTKKLLFTLSSGLTAGDYTTSKFRSTPDIFFQLTKQVILITIGHSCSHLNFPLCQPLNCLILSQPPTIHCSPLIAAGSADPCLTVVCFSPSIQKPPGPPSYLGEAVSAEFGRLLGFLARVGGCSLFPAGVTLILGSVLIA